MSYGDGGFYFLQPVGNGYSGIEVMLNPQRGTYGSMGGSRSASGSSSTAFTASQFDKIVSKFKSYTQALYKKAWGYAAFTSERAAADKAWATADRALGQLRVMKGSLSSAKWKYADLPSAVQTGIGSWVLRDVLKVPSVPTVISTAQAIRPVRQPSVSGLSSLAPGGTRQVQTLQMASPQASVMGPQSVVSDEEAAVAQAQTDLSQQAAQTVSAATDATGGAGISGLLSTTTGKVVTGTAVAGLAYLIWRNRRSIFGG